MKLEEIGQVIINIYDLQTINGKTKIVISQIKILDKQGKFVKFGKLKEILPYLGQLPVSFKAKEME